MRPRPPHPERRARGAALRQGGRPGERVRGSRLPAARFAALAERGVVGGREGERAREFPHRNEAFSRSLSRLSDDVSVRG